MMLALGRHLADSTVFALVVWLVCLCMKRRGPAARYALWLVAVAKFVVPTAVFLQLGESLGGLLPRGQVLAVIPTVLSQWMISSATYEPSRAATLSWSDLLVVTWMVGIAVAFALWIRNLRSSSVPPHSLKDPQPAWFLRMKAQIGFRGEVRFGISDSAREPALAGFRRPAVLIPAALTDELSAPELESVALHELAHAKRRDNWTAAFAHAVTCVFWFYPLLWWLEKRLHAERELACDEMVIRCGAVADDYFAGILKVCRFHLVREIAGVAGISGSNLKDRKEAIMSVSPNAPARRFPKMLIVALITAVVGVPLVIGLLSSPNARAADGAFAAAANTAQRTLFTMARQTGAPARLVEATFGIKSLLLQAKLENVGNRAITQYQIGWVVVDRDGKIGLSSGELMNVPAQIAPGAVAQVPDQGVSPKFLDEHPREIMFFLDEAKFSTNELWRADGHSIEIEASAGKQTAVGSKRSKTQEPITCMDASIKYPEGTVIQQGNGPEQMCARTLDPYDTHRTGKPVYYPSWIYTNEAIRQRSAKVLHIPPQPEVYCSPGPASQYNRCTCQAEGEFSNGALVNSAIGPYQLRCKNGHWVQVSTLNVKRP